MVTRIQNFSAVHIVSALFIACAQCIIYLGHTTTFMVECHEAKNDDDTFSSCGAAKIAGAFLLRQS